jgi:hypothetical protein
MSSCPLTSTKFNIKSNFCFILTAVMSSSLYLLTSGFGRQMSSSQGSSVFMSCRLTHHTVQLSTVILVKFNKKSNACLICLP